MLRETPLAATTGGMVVQPPLPVLLTRPQAQSRAFAETLPSSLAPIISPLLEITFRSDVERAPPGTTVIFTSANGVAAYMARHSADGLVAICVGTRTAAVARDAGFQTRTAGGDAEGVVALALSLPGPFLHVRGEHARGDIASRLQKAGKIANETIAYAQNPNLLTNAAREALKGPCLVPLFSPRTAKIFFSQYVSAPEAILVCISAAVAAEVPASTFRKVEVAKQPNAASMRAALLAHATGNNLETGKGSG